MLGTVSSVDDPWEVLGVSRSDSVERVEARWRELRARLHPDAGGDHDTYVRAEAAHRRVMSILARRPGVTGPAAAPGAYRTRPVVRPSAVAAPIVPRRAAIGLIWCSAWVALATNGGLSGWVALTGVASAPLAAWASSQLDRRPRPGSR